MSILVSKQNCWKIFKTVLKYVIFLVKEETKSYFLIDIWSPKFTLISVASGVISAFCPLRCCRATSHTFFRPIFALKKKISYEHVSQCLNFLFHFIAFRYRCQITCTWLKRRILEKEMISKTLTLCFFSSFQMHYPKRNFC